MPYIIVLAIAVIVGGLTFYDEPLTDRSKEVIELALRSVPDHENAYLAMFGAHFDTDKPLHVKGWEVLDQLSEADLRIQDLPGYVSFKIEETKSKEYCSSSNSTTCRKSCCWNAEEIKTELAKHPVSLDNYKKLLEYKKFKQLGFKSDPEGYFRLQRIIALDLLNQLHNGEANIALSNALAVLDTLNSLLEYPATTIDSLFVTIAKKNILYALSDIIKDSKITASELLRTKQTIQYHETKTITQNVLSGHVAETFFLLELLSNNTSTNKSEPSTSSTLKLKYLYKPNITINKMVDAHDNVLNNNPGRIRTRDRYYDFLGQAGFNLLGDISVGSRFESTIKAIEELNAVSKLVLTQIDLLENNVPHDQIQSALQDMQADHLPPIQWESNNKRLFIQLENASEGKSNPHIFL